jgi:putative ABC transport system ATP-binding protein
MASGAPPGVATAGFRDSPTRVRRASDAGRLRRRSADVSVQLHHPRLEAGERMTGLAARPERTGAPIGSAGTPVFRARGLTKIYRTGDVEVHALRGVDLDLYGGELLVLLGASGSGKSTLLNILGGLDTPTAGEVRFLDHDLAHADRDELTRYRREHVGFVFQFYNLIPSLTARENVALVTDIAHDPMPAEEALRLVGLGERLDHFPAQLSGGEQQRVAIARAVAKRPDVMLCDEPTGALDAETGRLVLSVIERVNVELGTTTAVITHNAPIAAMADRVLRMTSGRISEERRNARRARPEEITW